METIGLKKLPFPCLFCNRSEKMLHALSCTAKGITQGGPGCGCWGSRSPPRRLHWTGTAAAPVMRQRGSRFSGSVCLGARSHKGERSCSWTSAHPWVPEQKSITEACCFFQVRAPDLTAFSITNDHLSFLRSCEPSCRWEPVSERVPRPGWEASGCQRRAVDPSGGDRWVGGWVDAVVPWPTGVSGSPPSKPNTNVCQRGVISGMLGKLST